MISKTCEQFQPLPINKFNCPITRAKTKVVPIYNNEKLLMKLLYVHNECFVCCHCECNKQQSKLKTF